uniref:Reverse transcriptase domain-containing protein n=1 Tax=Cannabis sativa TaxID=3483 RepID=A0A803PUS7_CANSA
MLLATAHGWIGVIMDCVMTLEYAFLVNGRPKGRVVSIRGLRQECPLSPYLFLFCAKSLSSLISHVKARFKLMKFSDTETIKRILLLYEAASSQKINFEKSVITFSPNVQSADQDGVLHVLGLTSIATHDLHLGLPMVVGRNEKQTFEGICEKFDDGVVDSSQVIHWRNGVLNLAIPPKVKVFVWHGVVPFEPSWPGPTRWMPPPPDSFALMADASVVLGRGFVELGGAMRDATSVVWLAWSSCVLGEFSVNVAKLLAIRLAVVSGGSSRATLQFANSVAYTLTTFVTSLGDCV